MVSERSGKRRVEPPERDHERGATHGYSALLSAVVVWLRPTLSAAKRRVGAFLRAKGGTIPKPTGVGRPRGVGAFARDYASSSAFLRRTTLFQYGGPRLGARVDTSVGSPIPREIA